MSSSVSVIIVNYNAGDELTRCVCSLVTSSMPVEIVIVDNNSTDNSLVSVKKASPEFATITYIENSRNVGFAAACNQGLEFAAGDALLLLNPDCVVTNNTVECLYNALQKNPEAGMSGGLIRNFDGTEQRGCRRNIPTPWTSFVHSFGLKVLQRFSKKYFSDFRLDQAPLPEKATPVEAISGACMMLTRKALQDVGSMDEGYFLHCEDLDYCLQFTRKGWQILFVPDAILYHTKGRCSSSRPFFVEWSKHKGMTRFYYKNYNSLTYRLLLLPVLLGIWVRFMLVSLLIAIYQLKR